MGLHREYKLDAQASGSSGCAMRRRTIHSLARRAGMFARYVREGRLHPDFDLDVYLDSLVRAGIDSRGIRDRRDWIRYVCRYVYGRFCRCIY